MSRSAGYREIPQALIDEAAQSVGLAPDDVPPVVVRRGLNGGCYRDARRSKDGAHIEVGRRVPKFKVPFILRHELAHHKLRSHVTNATSWNEIAREELKACTIAEGKVGLFALFLVAEGMYYDCGATKREAITAAKQEAKAFGVPRRTRWAFSELAKAVIVRS